MEFSILGKKVSIGSQKQKSVQSLTRDLDFSYLGNTLKGCGEVQIDLHTYYKLHMQNATINSYYRSIQSKVGAKGLQLVDKDGEVVDDPMLVDEVQSFFSMSFDRDDLELFDQQFYTQLFCSGQVFGMKGQENGLGESRLRIVDTRIVDTKVDDYGDPVAYKVGKTKSQTFNTDDIYNHIVYLDPNKPWIGSSIYRGIVMDALTDAEAIQSQFYFFRNNARPDIMVVLDDAMLSNPDAIKEFKKQWRAEHQGSGNSGKTQFAGGVKDIKTLTAPMKDLDLSSLRHFVDTRIALVFGIDKRLIGFDKDVGGSRSEIDSISKVNGNAMIRLYAQPRDSFMTNSYKKFVDPDFQYHIKAINDYFVDEEQEKRLAMELAQKGIITLSEARSVAGYSLDDIPEELHQYYVQSSTIPIGKAGQSSI